MKILLAITILTASATLSYAQERAAAGAIDTQMTWSALSSKVDNAVAISQGLDFKINQIIKCNSKGRAYSPDTKGKDGDGCIGIDTLATLKTQVVSASVCEDARTGRNTGSADTIQRVERWSVYTKTVSCPKGWKLLACSGGPGDTDESGEGSYIQPVSGEGCKLVIGEPICTDRLYWTKSWVFAHCAKVE